MYYNLLAFNFVIGLILKMMAITYQTTATSLSFYSYNFIICMTKIVLLPIIASSNNKRMSSIIAVALLLSPGIYSMSILSMVVINSALIKILSDNKELDDQPKYSLFNRFGAFIGISLVPLYKMVLDKFGFLPVMSIIGISLCLLYYLCFNDILDSVDISKHVIENEKKRKRKVYDSNKGFIENIVFIVKSMWKYSDIVLLYLLLSLTGFVQSNLSFLTKCSNSAYTPLLALSFMSIDVDKKIKPIVFIPFALLSYYISSPILLCFCVLHYFITFKSKSHAEKKYGDAFIPHIVAHLFNDVLFASIYGTLSMYHYFY